MPSFNSAIPNLILSKMTLVNIAGIADSSTVDYPGKLCAVVYMCGCPYRCPWCQNPELVFGKGTCAPAEIDSVVKALKQNFLISAVCVTGGEPIMAEGAVELIRKIKAETGYLVKVDTNGCRAEELKKILDYVDFVSIDIKAPLDERYGKAIGIPDGWEKAASDLEKTIEMLRKSGVETEARTTVVPGLIESDQDIIKIARLVSEAGFSHYVLQQFRPMNTLDPSYRRLKSPSREKLLAFGKVAKKHLPSASVRIVTQERGFEEIHL